MDERKTSAEQETRRKRQENPLLQADGRRSQRDQRNADAQRKERTVSRRNQPENDAGSSSQRTNVYKLRILTIILVLLIIALIAAFVTEVGIYGKQDSGTNGSAAGTPAQTEQAQKTDAEEQGMGDSLAGL